MRKTLQHNPSLSLAIRYIPLADLKPSPHNARIHPPAQIKALMKSIDAFGFLIPILIGPDNSVIAGHGRIEAAKQLRVSKVPTISIDHLTPAQQRAYRVADNRLTELADWDSQVLGEEFAFLMTVPDLDMTVTGFEIPKIDLLIQGTQEASEAPEDESLFEPKPIMVTEPGDLWVLGDHLIFCGNSLEEESYERILECEIAQQVITDPPYNVPINRHVCGSGKIQHAEFQMASGEMTKPEFTAFLLRVFDLMAHYSKSGSIHHIFMDWRHIGEIIVHRDKSYPGNHEEIIDAELFETAQKLLAENRVKKLNGTGKKAPCMLTGRLFDDRGHPMSPKHSRTRRLYYRYYTSQAVIKGTPHEAGSLPNIPAHEIERLVKAEVEKFLKDGQRIQPLLKEEVIKTQQYLLKTAAELTWQTSDEARLFVKSVVHRVELSDHDIKIELCGESIIQALKGEMHARPIGTKNKILIAREVKLAPTRDGSKVVVGSESSGKNMQLIKAITRSFLWNEQLLSGEKRTVRELGLQENIKTPSYVAKVMQLRFLAPNIIESILDGTHSADWTVEKLFAINSTNWQEQRKTLGLTNP